MLGPAFLTTRKTQASLCPLHLGTASSILRRICIHWAAALPRALAPPCRLKACPLRCLGSCQCTRGPGVRAPCSPAPWKRCLKQGGLTWARLTARLTAPLPQPVHCLSRWGHTNLAHHFQSSPPGQSVLRYPQGRCQLSRPSHLPGWHWSRGPVDLSRAVSPLRSRLLQASTGPPRSPSRPCGVPVA